MIKSLKIQIVMAIFHFSLHYSVHFIVSQTYPNSLNCDCKISDIKIHINFALQRTPALDPMPIINYARTKL